jgi:rSAM/selenodomain-associated transferase 2
MNSPSLAVVIPTLNEAATLPSVFQSLQHQDEPARCAVIADGGSTDGTADIAAKFGATVVEAPRRGRGHQIAAALREITESIVLILHADMHLPANALALIGRRLLDEPACPGGCLGHRFDSPRIAYRLVEWYDRRRALGGMSYGDQGQFFRRELLEQAGGFPDQPIMEDVALSWRLCSLGRPAYLDCPVIVSPRRFERLGLWRTAISNFRVRRAYERGGIEACEDIYRRYYDER